MTELTQQQRGVLELSKNYGEDVIGLLNIQIAEAALTRDTEWVGKMDPFVTFDVDGQ